MKFKNQIIIVTGASDGLWKAISKILIFEWAIVLWIGRTAKKLENVEKEFWKNFVGYQADLSKKDDLDRVYNEIFSSYKKIDILINNAAIWHEWSIEEHDLSVLESLVMTNIFAVMWSVFKVYPSMKKNGRWQILNINSTAWVDICPERAPYSWTKFAITGYTKGLYEEASKFGVKVMQIHPGWMDTNIFEKFKKWYGKQEWMMDKNIVAKIIVDILSKPDEIVLDGLVVRKKWMI